MERMTLSKFINRYLETNTAKTFNDVINVLIAQHKAFNCDGWVLVEKESRDGRSVLLPFGRNNTLTSIPDKPFSHTGLTSDLSVVVGWISAKGVNT